MTPTVEAILALVAAAPRDAAAAVRLERDGAASVEVLAAEVKRLRALTAVSLGVGDGFGQQFVYGDYESITAAQALILRTDPFEPLHEAARAMGRQERPSAPLDLEAVARDLAYWTAQGDTGPLTKSPGFRALLRTADILLRIARAAEAVATLDAPVASPPEGALAALKELDRRIADLRAAFGLGDTTTGPAPEED